MKLTPEQKKQVQQAKARGEPRIFMQFTPEQRKAWREAVERELAGKEQNTAHFRKVKAAAELPGFFGDIRRAIFYSRRPFEELSATIGIDSSTLSDFCAGDADLPGHALERLIEAFGLRLMQEIPK